MQISGLEEELQLARARELPRLLYVIPEGAGMVNGSCEADVWVLGRFFVVGGRPSAR
jgi:hypothetical protein